MWLRCCVLIIEKKTFLKGIMPLDLLIERCRYCLVSILFCKKLTRVGQKS